MLNPFKSGFFAIQLISHKVLRYAVPFVLATLLVLSILLAPQSTFYAAILVMQLGLYLLAFMGWILERSGKRAGPLAIPLYFVLANVASAVAFYKFLRGETYARWEPVRHKPVKP